MFLIIYLKIWKFEDCGLQKNYQLSIINYQLIARWACRTAVLFIVYCSLFPNPSATLVPLQRGHLRAYVGSVGYFCICPVVVVTRPLPFPRGVPATAGEGFKNYQLSIINLMCGWQWLPIVFFPLSLLFILCKNRILTLEKSDLFAKFVVFAIRLQAAGQNFRSTPHARKLPIGAVFGPSRQTICTLAKHFSTN